MEIEEAGENIDFDFFESPRKKQQTGSPKQIVKDNLHVNRNGFERPKTAILSKRNDRNEQQKIRDDERNSSSGSEHYSDSFESCKNSDDSDSSASEETSRKRSDRNLNNRTTSKSEHIEGIVGLKRKENRVWKRDEGEHDRRSGSYSGSSSTYSDGLSDEEISDKKSKKTVNVRVPKAYMEAWGTKTSTVTFEPQKHSDRKRKEENDNHRERDKHRDGHPDRDSFDSESHTGSGSSPDRHTDGSRRTERQKHLNAREGRPPSGHHRKDERLPRRNSLSDSNNSDITEVSPLVTPESTPRTKSSSDRYGKEVGADVQFKIPEDDSVLTNIKLDSDKIDLNVLMQCMAEIDYEKRQRLKTNTRRVMFAPARQHVNADRPKSNYSFPADRVKLIEHENQRLLNEIMKNDSRQNNKPIAKRKTKEMPVPPQRLTPSAVNRQREQRKIEMENMAFLRRLHGIRATKGMARNEQLKEFDETMHYGIPLGAALPTKPETNYRSGDLLSTTSSVYGSGGKRSRPSSAKSNASVSSIRSSVRSRPSSAKSNVSMISKRSKGSRPGSAKSTKSLDNRPAWDDRFSCV